MKPSVKIIDLTTGAASYSISNADRVMDIVLVGDITMNQNVEIIYGNGITPAPVNTVIRIIKVAVVIQGPAAKLKLFGQTMTDNIAKTCDYIICIKKGTLVNDWRRIYLASLDLKVPSPIAEERVVGNDANNYYLDFAGFVDGKTIKWENDQFSVVIPSESSYSVIDDFVEAISKDSLNGALIAEAAGAIQLSATTINGGAARVNSKNPIIKRETTPRFDAKLKINTRGSSTVYIGLADSYSAPTMGAYFKLSTTSMEIFTVVNDGTERIVTSGLNAPLSTYTQYSIQVNPDGSAVFSIDGVVVRTETTYHVPAEAYNDLIFITGAVADTVVSVDYVKIDMNRV